MAVTMLNRQPIGISSADVGRFRPTPDSFSDASSFGVRSGPEHQRESGMQVLSATLGPH
jgi:hypothetical protein